MDFEQILKTVSWVAVIGFVLAVFAIGVAAVVLLF